MPSSARTEGLILAGLLLAVVFVLSIRLDQPIVENYVGRQIPTAMVARNLTRGSGFLSPTLDTGPFPNLFLVEPPVDAQVVAWTSTLTGLRLDSAGRLVSALSTTLAAWGLFGLARRRSNLRTAVATVLAFAAFPVTLRYGRAFQPDPLAMGLVVAGICCWDRGTTPSRIAGWFCLLIGLAQKLSWGFVLAPLVLVILEGRSRKLKALALTTTLGAICWYLHAAIHLEAATSAASTDNATRWLARLAPSAFLEIAPYGQVARDLSYRAFTPVGVGLAVIGLVGWSRADRLWRVWIVSAAVAMLVLFGKLHHQYYWLMMAPPVAAWVGIAIGRISRPGLAVGVVVILIGMGVFQARSTWTTPDAWRAAPALADAIRRLTDPTATVIAPEAVLYLGDRRGCRLEYDAVAARRAANEWRPSPSYTDDDPAALIDFYRKAAGARYFADLATHDEDAGRKRLHERVRNAPGARILDDRPGSYLIVEFEDPQSHERALK